MSEFKCECRICERHVEYDLHLTNLQEVIPYLQEPKQNPWPVGVEEAIKFFEKIYNDLNNVEMDNDVNRAIIDGSWHTADEQIKWARIRRKEK